MPLTKVPFIPETWRGGIDMSTGGFFLIGIKDLQLLFAVNSFLRTICPSCTYFVQIQKSCNLSPVIFAQSLSPWRTGRAF